MATYFAGGQNTYDSLSIQEATERGLRWDVFVSHKSNDTPIAVDVVRAIQSQGLSAWVDVADPTVQDGPDLADHIARVLSRSFSLLAVVTRNTQGSWWVPFEVGIAFDMQKYLASFGDKALNPTFLAKWPNVPDDPPGHPSRNADLQRWCRHLTLLRLKVITPSFVPEMRRLAAAFG